MRYLGFFPRYFGMLEEVEAEDEGDPVHATLALIGVLGVVAPFGYGWAAKWRSGEAARPILEE